MIYNENELNQIKDILTARDETISVAESVTSGHLQAAFSAAMEASEFFQGGITTYNLGQKTRHLDVDPILCEKVSCVSAKVAESMALGACKLFSSTYGIATTGFATIVEECKEEGLHAFIAIAYKDKIVLSEKLTVEEKHPVEVQISFANMTVSKLLGYLKSI